MLLLPARVPYWHVYGDDGPAMKRLFAELQIDADKHPSLWRLPLWVTGCQNASEMDKQGWQYDDVLTLCKAVVVQKKWECRHSIRQMERKVFRIVYVLPEVKPCAIKRPTDKPILFDGFCGQGGAAKGYQMAGFYVVGMDIEPQPRYCGDEFIQGDVMEYLAKHGHEYDAIHVSPPCQEYSVTRTLHDNEYPDLVNPVRELLKLSGKPYVIENVVGAPLENALMLCGTMFGLKVIRHRLFECNPPLYFAPAPCQHLHKTAKRGEYDKGQHGYITVAGHNFNVAYAKKAMGIDWMTRDGLAEAVPPLMTEYTGGHLMKALGFGEVEKAA